MRYLVEAWFSVGVRAIPVLFVANCAEPLALEGRHCPCAEGYQCCESGNACMRESETCPSWKSLDEAALDAFDLDGAATGWTFDVAPDGTPYLTVLHCGDDCYRARRVPTVMRYENEVWTTLPSDGLPEAAYTPQLIVEANGTLHLLIDVTDEEGLVPRSIISSFDGVRWEERVPRVLGQVLSSVELASGPFELDDSNRFVTALLDQSDVNLAFSILRLENTGWLELGAKISSVYPDLQLALRDDSVCATYTDLSDNALLRCLEGSEWTIVRSFDGFLAPGFFIAPDGTFYLARNDFIAGVVMYGKGDDWAELPPVQSQRTELTVTRDGSVFLSGVGTDLPTRFAFWDEELDDWGYLTNAGISEDAFALPIHHRFEVAEAGKVPYFAIQSYVGDTESLLRIYKHE